MSTLTKTRQIVLKDINELLKGSTFVGRYVYPDDHFDSMGADGELFDTRTISREVYTDNSYDIGDIF